MVTALPMKTCVYSRHGCISACFRTSVLTVMVVFPTLAPSQSVILNEVVVTASRVPVPVTDVIADVSIIDRTVLDLAGQSSLRDVLAQLPGVQLSSTGSYRSSTNVYLRGAASSQALVLIDGVRVGSATSGSAAFENLPLDRIERVEVLRGAASALYGPDAVGGVIQIFTRDPVDTLQLSANTGAGSDGQFQAGASVRGRNGAIGYSLGLSKEKATGINVATNPAASSYNPDQDSFDVNSVDAKLSVQLSSQQALTLGVLQSKMNYQFDGTITPNPLGLTKWTTDAWRHATLRHASLKWDAQWAARWKSSLIVGRSDDVSVNEYYRLADGAFNGRNQFNTRRTQTTWQNDINLGTDVLTALLENRTEAIDSTTNYSVKERDVSGVMLSYALKRPDWNALAVLRSDDNSQFGHFRNWALSGGYKFTAAWRAVASVGTSFQAPSFNQLYYPGFGIPTLLPQQNRASEMGLKYHHGVMSMAATLYYNEIQGFINPVTNVQNNLAVLRGLTLDMQARRGHTRYAVTYDYADPHTQPDGLRFARIAQNVLNFSAHHRVGLAELWGELKFSSDREDAKLVGNGRDVLPGYGLLNLGVNWKISRDLSALVRLNNVSDTSYALANGYSMPGRNVLASLTWSL